MAERKKIPKIMREFVHHRQDGKCCCCMERGEHIHHVLAYSLTEEHITVKNLILLCKNHHNLFHLGDPETYQSVYEYAWYLQNGKIPEDKDLSEISEEVQKYLNDRNF